MLFAPVTTASSALIPASKVVVACGEEVAAAAALGDMTSPPMRSSSRWQERDFSSHRLLSPPELLAPAAAVAFRCSLRLSRELQKLWARSTTAERLLPLVCEFRPPPSRRSRRLPLPSL
jgi:hypothetical protein